MQQAGGLIKLHYHTNLSLLELFSETNNILYYRGSPLFQNIQISQKQHNKLTRESDGLFVDGTFIDRFEYINGELLFDGIIVSREYTNQQITNTINSLWSPDPYLEIGKIDMSHWFVLHNDSNTKKVYENTSKDTVLDLLITNQDNQDLIIKYGVNTLNSNNSEISIKLPANSYFEVKESSDATLNITIELL